MHRCLYVGLLLIFQSRCDVDIAGKNSRRSSLMVGRQHPNLMLSGSGSAVDLLREVRKPLSINFSTRKFKTVVLFLSARYSCFMFSDYLGACIGIKS